MKMEEGQRHVTTEAEAGATQPLPGNTRTDEWHHQKLRRRKEAFSPGPPREHSPADLATGNF